MGSVVKARMTDLISTRNRSIAASQWRGWLGPVEMMSALFFVSAYLLDDGLRTWSEQYQKAAARVVDAVCLMRKSIKQLCFCVTFSQTQAPVPVTWGYDDSRQRPPPAWIPTGSRFARGGRPQFHNIVCVNERTWPGANDLVKAQWANSTSLTRRRIAGPITNKVLWGKIQKTHTTPKYIRFWRIALEINGTASLFFQFCAGLVDETAAKAVVAAGWLHSAELDHHDIGIDGMLLPEDKANCFRLVSGTNKTNYRLLVSINSVPPDAKVCFESSKAPQVASASRMAVLLQPLFDFSTVGVREFVMERDVRHAHVYVLQLALVDEGTVGKNAQSFLLS